MIYSEESMVSRVRRRIGRRRGGGEWKVRLEGQAARGLPKLASFAARSYALQSLSLIGINKAG